MRVTPQFHGSVLQPDLLTFLLTFLRPEMNFKNISPHGEIVFDLTQNSVKAVLTVSNLINDYDAHLCFSMIKCLRARRGCTFPLETYIVNKTAFADFCFSKLISRSFVSNLCAKLSRGTGPVARRVRKAF